jgi:hypothetical protein
VVVPIVAALTILGLDCAALAWFTACLSAYILCWTTRK